MFIFRMVYELIQDQVSKYQPTNIASLTIEQLEPPFFLVFCLYFQYANTEKREQLKTVTLETL